MRWTVLSPRPVPLPLFLGGEERLEDVGHGVGVDAMAVVADGQHNAMAGANAVLARDRLAEVRVGGFDADAAAGGHGVAGVQDQVHDDLLHLAGVGARPCAGSGLRLVSRSTCSPMTSASMRWRSRDDRVQVERPRADGLAAREAEQLRSQPRAAIGGLADFVELRRGAGPSRRCGSEECRCSRRSGSADWRNRGRRRRPAGRPFPSFRPAACACGPAGPSWSIRMAPAAARRNGDAAAAARRVHSRGQNAARPPR